MPKIPLPTKDYIVPDYDKEQTVAINEIDTEIKNIKNDNLLINEEITELKKDYIVDFGNNENGSWEKWKSGKLVQRVQTNLMTTDRTTSGNNSIYNNNEVVVFPIPFYGEPVSVFDGSKRNIGVVWSGVREITSNNVDLLLIGATNNASGIAFCEAVGRWK